MKMIEIRQPLSNSISQFTHFMILPYTQGPIPLETNLNILKTLRERGENQTHIFSLSSERGKIIFRQITINNF